MRETAVLLCGHGSRDPEAVAEFEDAAAQLRSRLPEHDFAAAYLEFARPTIADGLADLAARGARRILAAPAMLFAASHVKKDLPREIDSFMAAHPGIEVRLGRDLAADEKLLRAAAARIEDAVPKGRSDTLLLVVGRGASDPETNSNIANIASLLREQMGFGGAEAAFSGIAHPPVDVALERAAGRGLRRVAVFPYFLFTGVLVKRIHAQTDAAAARFPEIQFVKAGHLRDHPLVLEAILDRIGVDRPRDPPHPHPHGHD